MSPSVLHTYKLLLILAPYWPALFKFVVKWLWTSQLKTDYQSHQTVPPGFSECI